MFNFEEFRSTPTWDLEHKVFFQYCDWCFVNCLDNDGNDCEECHKRFWEEIKRRKDNGSN